MKVVQLIIILLVIQFSAFSGLIYSNIQIAGDEKYQYTPTSCLRDKYRSLDEMETLNVHNLCASALSLSECRALLNVEKEEPIELQVHKVNTACDLPQGSGYSLPATAIAAARLGGALLPAVHATYTKPGKTIKNLEDFYRHTTLHKKRVVALGLYLYDKRPDLFEGLDRKTLEAALVSHDNAKINPQYTDKKGRPFYRALYEDGFGRRPPQDLVDSLNQSDAKIMEEKIKKLGLGDNAQLLKAEGLSDVAIKQELERRAKLRAMIKRIETLADLTDRGLASVTQEEYGRAMVKSSEFVRNKDDAKILKELLEKDYDKIVEGLEYREMNPKQRAALRRKIAIQENTSRVNKNPKWLRKFSANALTSSISNGARRNGLILAANIKNTAANINKRAFLKATPVEILIASLAPSDLGCDSPSMIDWHHDGVKCHPINEMTPKFMSFLNLEDPNKIAAALSDSTTCNTFENIYKKTVLDAANHAVCRENELSFTSPNYGAVSAITNGDKVTSLELIQSTGNRFFNRSPFGEVTRINLDDQGKISGLCYRDFMARTAEVSEKKCLNTREILRSPFSIQDSLDQANVFLKAINFRANALLTCCRGEKSDVLPATFCSQVNYISANK